MDLSAKLPEVTQQNNNDCPKRLRKNHRSSIELSDVTSDVGMQGTDALRKALVK